MTQIIHKYQDYTDFNVNQTEMLYYPTNNINAKDIANSQSQKHLFQLNHYLLKRQQINSLSVCPSVKHNH